jgi:hypothetical protein
VKDKSLDPLLDAPQKGGGSLRAGGIEKEIREWLHESGCDGCVSPLLIKQYAMACGRWEQAEQELSKHGLIAAKNGGVTESPFVGISERYQKQSNELLDRIKREVRIARNKKGGTNEQDHQPDHHGAGRKAGTVCQ